MSVIASSNAKVVFTWVEEYLVLLRYNFFLPCKRSRHFLIQSEAKQNQQWLARTLFPALCVSYKHLLRVLIGCIRFSEPFVTEQYDYFCYGFTTPNWKLL